MRLIDAYENEQWAKEHIFDAKKRCAILDFLRECSTIDAVPVVRCRDCKHYMAFRTNRNNQPMRMCYRMGKYDMEFHVKPNDFCSYGRPKEAGDE